MTHKFAHVHSEHQLDVETTAAYFSFVSFPAFSSNSRLVSLTVNIKTKTCAEFEQINLEILREWSRGLLSAVP